MSITISYICSTREAAYIIKLQLLDAISVINRQLENCIFVEYKALYLSLIISVFLVGFISTA